MRLPLGAQSCLAPMSSEYGVICLKRVPSDWTAKSACASSFLERRNVTVLPSGENRIIVTRALGHAVLPERIPSELSQVGRPSTPMLQIPSFVGVTVRKNTIERPSGVNDGFP